MAKFEFNAFEKEMMDFDFESLEKELKSSQEMLVSATAASDVKTKICSVWSRIRKYVKWAENVPFAGRFIKILSDLLDTICGI